jgi:type VI secretion system protein ImpL
MSNPDELEVYLAMQREAIAELAGQYAALLGITSAQNISLRSSVNWKEILDQLEKYDAKKPGSTVTVLENFIRFEMDKVKLDKCEDIIVGSTLQPLDYFIRVRNSLRQPFYARCKVLEAVEIARAAQLGRESAELARQKKVDDFCNALKSYTAIQEAFDLHLAGKFPFSDLPKAEPFGEAEPDDINAFFKVWTENNEAARSILKDAPDYDIPNTEALRFLEQMKTVSIFFAAFLEKKQQFPALDFSLRFRVNEPKQEIGGNQIIDWTFDVGGKRFGYREQDATPPAGIWGYGEPLSLSLRWANDSPTIPSALFPPQSHMKLEGQTVTLRYDNRWSLLLLLLKHKGQAEDFTEGVDVEPYTIKFVIPTQPNPRLSNVLQQAQPEILRTSFVEVFMRISLLTPSKKDPLILPDVFPTFAPQLAKRCIVIQQSRERRSN